MKWVNPNTKCVSCRKAIGTAPFHQVEGGSVMGTAGTRRRPSVYWHQSCWDTWTVRYQQEQREADKRNQELCAQVLDKYEQSLPSNS